MRKVYTPSLYYIISTVNVSLHQHCGKLKCQHMSAIVYAPNTKPQLTWHCPSNHPSFTTGPFVQTPYVLPLWVWLVDDHPYHFHSLVSEVVDWTRCVAPCVLGLQGRTNLGLLLVRWKKVTPIPQLAIGNPRFFLFDAAIMQTGWVKSAKMCINLAKKNAEHKVYSRCHNWFYGPVTKLAFGRYALHPSSLHPFVP